MMLTRKLTACLMLMLLAGCTGDSVSKPDTDDVQSSETPAKADFVVIDDQPLAAAVERQLRAQANLDVTVVRMSRAELQNLKDRRLKTDIVIYPVDMLGWMIDNELLTSFPPNELSSDDLANNDLLPIQRNVIPKLGSRQYAMSLGSPSFVLIYRSDILKELKIEPPQTWPDYQNTVEKIERVFASDEGTRIFESATCEPLAENWAAQILLARVAAYIRQFGTYSTMFDIDTMQPQIDKPPFVRGLTELVAAAKTSEVDWTKIYPGDAEQMVLDGRTAMAISWPTKNRRRESKSDQDRIDVTITSIPGSNRYFQYRTQQWRNREESEPISVPLVAATGRLASVSRGSQQSSFAFQLIGLITSKEMSANISPESEHTTAFRTSQLAGISNWMSQDYASGADQQYAEVLERWNDKNLFLQTLRIPGQDEYLAELSAAVDAALSDTDPQVALKAAAKRWSEITKSHGMEKQKSAYLKCFGIDYNE